MMSTRASSETFVGSASELGGLWVRVMPLWRYALFFVALFVVASASVAVRLDVQQLHKSLDRNYRAERDAQVLHERLLLERDVRRGAGSLEQLATRHGLGTEARVVWVKGQ